mmetsp:Transcript_1417/g.1347  ORF Transcript_1417/g.1347 Transcript_1417/m.1347 type:complete len:110 (-) Transcript_1417:1573-1902(-)
MTDKTNSWQTIGNNKYKLYKYIDISSNVDAHKKSNYLMALKYFLNHSTILEQESSNRLSTINSTVEPIALARSSCSGKDKSVYLMIKSPSITPFFLSLFLHPPLLGARR